MKNLYIVFSSTPYKIGKIIRILTKEKYNHTAIYAGKEHAYCFGRHYQNVLLYGGMVKDSFRRYIYNGKTADICVCAIELEDEKFDQVCSLMDEMYSHKQEYYYNILSALSALRHKRVFIHKAYTCVEFSSKILSLVDKRIDPNEFYTIETLRQKFIDNVVYNGKFNMDMADDNNYIEKKSIGFKIKHSFENIRVLFARL